LDHEALVHQLELAETDPLTGVHTRAAGLLDLDHELERSRRRIGRRLVVVYIDVVELKTVKDSDGRAAAAQRSSVACSTLRDLRSRRQGSGWCYTAVTTA
jgi:GGDEF domain-containing protein